MFNITNALTEIINELHRCAQLKKIELLIQLAQSSLSDELYDSYVEQVTKI